MLRSRLSSAFRNPPPRFFVRLGLDGLILSTLVRPRGRGFRGEFWIALMAASSSSLIAFCSSVSPSLEMVRPNLIGAVLPSTFLSGGGSSPKHTTITVTLSHVSLRSASRASSLAAAAGSLCRRSAVLAKSTALCELNTSHSPSHAMITNSSSRVITCVSTSGTTMSGPGGSPSPLLSPSMWKSPKALATPRCPLMYPSST
mmetsp:Transcript_3320/g.8884  ORF Transcript_3320/g.8884 Transcript_3320/m.8884 type:complete len:201 (-) Transcript_3320:732-1334(-)